MLLRLNYELNLRTVRTVGIWISPIFGQVGDSLIGDDSVRQRTWVVGSNPFTDENIFLNIWQEHMQSAPCVPSKACRSASSRARCVSSKLLEFKHVLLSFLAIVIKFKYIPYSKCQDIKCLSSAFSRHNEFEFDIVQQASLFAIVFSTSPVSRCHPIFLLALWCNGAIFHEAWTRLELMKGENCSYFVSSNNETLFFFVKAAFITKQHQAESYFSLQLNATCRTLVELVFWIYYVYLISMKKGC